MNRLPTTRLRAGRALFVGGCATFLWAAIVFLSGGFVLHLLGRTISARVAARPLLVSVLLLVASRAMLPPAEFAWLARSVIGDRRRRAPRVAAAAAACVLVVGIAWNTWASGGSDSSCYALQAEAFAHGDVLLRHPLAGTISDVPPPAFAPTGFIPSPSEPFAAVPICAPGLALMMTIVRPVGRNAAFVVVPLCAAMTVWATFAFGRRAADDVVGAAAACLVACSPIFLYQSVQPMSDIPATAFWLAALVAAARGDRVGQIAGGGCASLAVLTRPNLILAIVPFLSLLPNPRAWLRWGVAAAPAALTLAALNAVRYGSPLATGYSSTGDLFAISHVTANIERYPRWFVETNSPLMLLAIAAPWVMRRDRTRRRLAIVALAASALVAAPYFAYTVFDDWWYLRFLLPVIPVALVYALAVGLRAVPDGGRPAIAFLIATVVGAWCLHVAATRHVFELQALESRFVRTGRYAGTTPANTIFIAGQETGSIRYHGDRLTLGWGAIPPASLDRTIDALAQRGWTPLIALDDAEEFQFRQRFAGQRDGALDWRPFHEITARTRVRIYDPADRTTGGK